MVDKYGLIKAAQLIAQSDGLLIAAGAGMGVDSGLPDFRGNDGFWKSYPALQSSGVDFREMASPSQFWSAPRMAWGFYGHRLALYRRTQPHAGFGILRQIAAKLPGQAFVYTSNVDGQFQKAGFSELRMHECHGSIHHLQCMNRCRQSTWPADAFEPLVDQQACRLLNDLPVCPHCGGLARPNVLMFNDMEWVPARAEQQRERLESWLQQVRSPVVVELGAGTAVPTVRSFGASQGLPFIRINIRDAYVRPSLQRVSLAMGALPALEEIHAALADSGFFRPVA